MSLVVRIVPTDPTPPYEQLRRQIATAILTGELRAGDRLPPVRQLAGDLGIATGTVARAYRLLEESGQLRTRRGAGTTVAADAGRGGDGRLTQLTRSFVAQARSLGASDEAIRAEVGRLLQPQPLSP